MRHIQSPLHLSRLSRLAGRRAAPLSKGFSRSRGMTLVELMVSIVILLLITIATVALYLVNSSSYRTVDSTQEMDANARYIFNIVGTAVSNAGFRSMVDLPAPGQTPQTSGVTFDSLFHSTKTNNCVNNAAAEPCPVVGFGSASLVSASTFGTANHANAINSSDMFAVRFYGSGTGMGDGNMVTCNGRQVPAPVAGTVETTSDLGMSMFWVSTANQRSAAETDTEPALYCTDQAAATATTMSRSTQQIARGVETMRVMYAEDVANAAGVAGSFDGVADRWVTASEVTNWQRVMAIRVGIVLRGQANSAQVRQIDTFYPLGKDFASGVTFEPAVADGRLRKAYVSTFTLRNKATP